MNHTIYKIVWSNGYFYIGRTDRSVSTRVEEHMKRIDNHVMRKLFDQNVPNWVEKIALNLTEEEAKKTEKEQINKFWGNPKLVNQVK